MKRDLWARNHLRLWALLGALAAVPLAHAQSSNLPAQAAPYSAFEWMQRQTTGNTTQAGMNIGGARVAASPINGSGWQRAGNYGVNNQINPSGLTFGASLEIPNGGQKINAQWRGFASKAAVADGVGILFRNAARLTGPLGLAVIAADFVNALDSPLFKLNDRPSTKDEKPFIVPEVLGGYWWKGGSGSCEFPTAMEAIRCAIAAANGISTGTLSSCELLSITQTQASGRCTYTPTGGSLTAAASSILKTSFGEKEANWDEARPTFESMNPLPSEVSQKMIDWARKQDGQNGIEPFKIMVDPLGLTGPSSFPPTTVEDKKTSTRTGADGRPETVETTTRKTTETGVTYDGDKVKVTPKETTTTTTKVTDADGNVRETTETDTKETTDNTVPKEETPDLCEKNPDIIACQKLGEPPDPEQLPKDTKDVTFTPVPFASSAACPAPLGVNWGFAGQTFAYEIAYTPLCNALADWVRPLLLLAAALFSVHVFTGGLKA